MNRVSATDLKNRVADILNEVILNGSGVIVERYGKPIAKITPVSRDDNLSKIEIKKILDKTFGSDPHFPEVTKFRAFRKKFPKL